MKKKKKKMLQNSSWLNKCNKNATVTETFFFISKSRRRRMHWVQPLCDQGLPGERCWWWEYLVHRSKPGLQVSMSCSAIHMVFFLAKPVFFLRGNCYLTIEQGFHQYSKPWQNIIIVHRLHSSCCSLLWRQIQRSMMSSSIGVRVILEWGAILQLTIDLDNF